VIGSSIITTAVNAALVTACLLTPTKPTTRMPPRSRIPAAGIVPAALAMAERERQNGTALIRAVALGYDVGCRLTQSLDAYQFRNDGHSTHSFGPMFGAAAAAGSLTGLREPQVRHYSVSGCNKRRASRAGCATGSTLKRHSTSRHAARNGVTAATMVAHGFTGVDDVFAGERNFFVPTRKPDPNVLVHGLGATYEIMNTNIKRWSVGSPIQAPLDSLLDVIREHQIKAEEVEDLWSGCAPGREYVDNRGYADNLCATHVRHHVIDGNVTSHRRTTRNGCATEKCLASVPASNFAATTRYRRPYRAARNCRISLVTGASSGIIPSRPRTARIRDRPSR